MSFQCYTSRTSLRAAMTGALFIWSDGRQRVIPDQWLHQAELLNESRLLRLTYSLCTIEVSGRALDSIFEDASIGKLGAIQVAPSESAPGGELWVTSIIETALPQSPFPVHEGAL